MEFVSAVVMGQPLWMWAAFLLLIAALLAFDLGILHRDQREIEVGESLRLSGVYIALGVAFGVFIWLQLGADAGLAYLTGFAVEKSLAIDNVFVIAMIFSQFGIPRALQHRVLFWGVLGVIVLRAVMIGAGVTLVTEFDWILYIFGGFLILTGVRMLHIADHQETAPAAPLTGFLRRRMRVTDGLHGDRFFVRLPAGPEGRTALYATPLFLALLSVEFVDVIFAVDSVPAILAITTDPYIVYTSNIFAILGLRALYFALAAILHRFAYLKHALAVLLIFIGSKILAVDMLGWGKFPAGWSLAGTVAILGAGIAYSLWRTRSPSPTLANGDS